MWTEIVTFIRDLGFPIFVSVFVLLRMEPTLHKLDKSIARLLEHLKSKEE